MRCQANSLFIQTVMPYFQVRQIGKFPDIAPWAVADGRIPPDSTTEGDE